MVQDGIFVREGGISSIRGRTQRGSYNVKGAEQKGISLTSPGKELLLKGICGGQKKKRQKPELNIEGGVSMKKITSNHRGCVNLAGRGGSGRLSDLFC